ncbi:MAG: sensor histidine kinase [Candidatus Thiodiazotropha sp.]
MWAFRNNSLERRLNLGLTISLLLLVGALWLTGSRFLQTMTEDFVASRLKHDAEALLGSLVISPRHVRVRQGRINQIYIQPFSGHYYLIQLADGRQSTSRSLWDFHLEFPQLEVGRSRKLRMEGPNGQQLLIWLGGFRKQDKVLTIAVAEDVAPIATMRERFQINFGLLSLGGLLLLLLLQRWVVRRSFQRLEPLRAEIQGLAESGGQQINEDVPSEIGPLVEELNHLLKLLTQRNERARNALGNLAHALKGPLNLLGRYFDRLPEDERKGEGEMAAIQAERIRLLIERELKRARMAGKGTPSQRFDPQRDLQDLVAVVRQVHQERSLEVDLQVDPALSLLGDREDMFELIGNLLDNAFKWAATRLRVRIVGGDPVTILVEDDGKGLSDQDLQRLTERGSRLDESVEGHGLGLSIALDIAKLYGGGIRFDRSTELGGLCVEVRLGNS